MTADPLRTDDREEPEAQTGSQLGSRRFVARLRAWLLRREHESHGFAARADKRDDCRPARLSRINRFAQEMGWPLGELRLTADGTLVFVEDPPRLRAAVPFSHGADPIRSDQRRQ